MSEIVIDQGVSDVTRVWTSDAIYVCTSDVQAHQCLRAFTTWCVCVCAEVA